MSQKLIALILFIFVPTIIFAHGSHGSGFMAGFTHPILGIDHNLAILGSGFLGYLLDQKKWYLAPLVFIAAMALGGFIGIKNEATFLIEQIIAFSVFSIGISIIFRTRLSLIFILGLHFVFGFFHGYAHGAEMPERNTVLKYIPGYTAGAILLSCIGFFIGKMVFLTKHKTENIVLLSGILMGCGIMMLL